MSAIDLAGKVIELRVGESSPALWPCRFCKSTKGMLTGPVGPHGGGVRCGACAHFLGWLPKERIARITEALHG